MSWFPSPDNYNKTGLLADLAAGLTLGILLIPQAMAYGLLAGVDPVYGLYAALVPMLIYSLLASTPHVNVGPTALASLLCLNGLSDIAEPFSAEYLGYVIVLAALTGVLQLLFGLLRLGGIISLLSRPVLSGFVSAAAVLIIFSQVDTLLGIETTGSSYLHETILSLWQGLERLHLPSTLLGVGALLMLFVAKRRLSEKLPIMLALLVFSTLLVGFMGRDWGVSTLENIPPGLPSFSPPGFEITTLRQLLPVAVVMALISFVETLSIGKAFASKHKYYRVLPNRELIALGLSKIAGAFFLAIPTSASFSRSAVVEGGGGRTVMSNVAAIVLLLVVLLFLTPWFYYLPVSVLAAIIIFSVVNLFDLAEMKRLWKLAPKELATLLITFFFTLFAGLQYGIAGGVLLSLFFVLWQAARPHLVELGRVPGTNVFRNFQRFAEAEPEPNILIVRLDAELYFGNADYFHNQMEAFVRARGEGLRAVIIDAHTIKDIDTSGIFVLSAFLEILERQGTELYLCGIIGPVRDKLFKFGLMERIGAANHFLSIQGALNHIYGKDDDRGWDLPAVQNG